MVMVVLFSEVRFESRSTKVGILQYLKAYSKNVDYSEIFYFCQYLHIGAGILSFGGDVF